VAGSAWQACQLASRRVELADLASLSDGQQAGGGGWERRVGSWARWQAGGGGRDLREGCWLALRRVEEAGSGGWARLLVSRRVEAAESGRACRIASRQVGGGGREQQVCWFVEGGGVRDKWRGAWKSCWVAE
jgi:hypothetical protein